MLQRGEWTAEEREPGTWVVRAERLQGEYVVTIGAGSDLRIDRLLDALYMLYKPRFRVRSLSITGTELGSVEADVNPIKAALQTAETVEVEDRKEGTRVRYRRRRGFEVEDARS